MIRLIRKWIINTFGFSKSETNGSILLIGLVILIAIVPRWFINTHRLTEVSTNADKIKLQEWYSNIEFTREISAENPKTGKTTSEPQLNIKSFDPNWVSRKELASMGIPDNVVNNIVNYRRAGGFFRTKNDLKKIYGMNEDLYARMEPHISFSKQLAHIKKESSYERPAIEKEEEKVLLSIPINQATAGELEKIRGIGPTLSKRIIKYRDLLGGFHTNDQLNEVYGLDEEVLNEITQNITIDSIAPAININDTDQKSLAAHPYVNYALASAIINYRTVHGPFKEKKGLKEIKIVSDSLYNKLSPYISVRP